MKSRLLSYRLVILCLPIFFSNPSISSALEILSPVTGIMPAAGSGDVSESAKIMVTFDRPMDSLSITSATFFLSGGIPFDVLWDAANLKAILAPRQPLRAGETYAVGLTHDVKDAGGAFLPNSLSWSFKVAGTMTPPPRITAVVPGMSEAGVDTRTAVKVVFATDMTPQTITPESLKIETVDGDVSYDPMTRTATLVPSQPLAYQTQYTVHINDSLYDLSGTPLTPLSWRFTTAAAGNGNPLVIETIPPDGSSCVDAGAPIMIRFTTPMDALAATTNVMQLDNGTTEAGISHDPEGMTFFFQPTGLLKAGTPHQAKVDGTMPTKTGITLGLPFVWSFAVSDDYRIGSNYVAKRSPAQDETMTSFWEPVDVWFSRPVEAETVSNSSFFMSDGVATSVLWDPWRCKATIMPLEPLQADRDYTLMLTDDIQSTDGHPLTATTSWTFKAGPPLPPPVTVQSFSPPNAGMGVDLETPVEVTFSGAIDPGTLSTLTFRIVGVQATLTYDAAKHVARLYPAVPLAPLTTYTVILSGIKSATAEPLHSLSWSFTSTFISPRITLSIDNGAEATNHQAVSLSLTKEPGGGDDILVRFSNDSISWTPWEPFAANHDWFLDSGEGVKIVYAEAKDAANRSTMTTASLVLDLTPPELAITTPVNDSATSNASITLTGTSQDSCGLKSLTVNGVSVERKSDGTFIKEVALTVGGNTIVVIATDMAGSQTTKNVNVMRTPLAVVNGTPSPVTNQHGVNILVGGEGITGYRYRFDGEELSAEQPISQPISTGGLLSIDGDAYEIGSDQLNNRIGLRDTFLSSLQFGPHKYQAEVSCLLNPQRATLERDTVVTLEGENLQGLELEVVPQGNNDTPTPADLIRIDIAGGRLRKAGVSNHYYLDVPAGSSSVQLKAIAAAPLTEILLDGQTTGFGSATYDVQIADGTSFSLSGLAQDGTRHEYQLTVTTIPRNNEANQLLSTYVLVPDPQNDLIRIHNAGADAVFTMNVNGKLFRDQQSILDVIVGMADEYAGEPLQRKAWRFVRDNRIHSSPITSKNWKRSPALFFNSLGYGLCDDAAFLLYQITRDLGFPVRQWSLSAQHSVIEVFVNGRWELWDADLEVYYHNHAGEIAGVEELQRDPALVTTPFDPILALGNIAYSQYMAGVYSNQYPNSWYFSDSDIQNFFDPGFGNYDLHFTLPKLGAMLFPTPAITPLDQSNSRLTEWRGLTLDIPAGWQGMIDIPLVINEIKTLMPEVQHTLEVYGRDDAGDWQTQPTKVGWMTDFTPPVTNAQVALDTDGGSRTIALSSNEPTTIYVTTDGSQPSQQSTVYTSPIDIASGNVLRFFAVDAAGNQEAVRSLPAPVRSVSLSDGRSNSVITKGEKILIQAQAQGESDNFEYRFSLREDGPNGTLLAIREYSQVNEWEWDSTSTTSLGVIYLMAEVRNRGSQDARETYSQIYYTLIPAPDPVNGTCGSSAGGTFTTAPAVSLCNAGEPSAVSGNGPWGWTCGGTDGGTAAQCFANIQSHMLTFAVSGDGSIASAAPQMVKHGDASTPVSAVASAGYHFVNWTGSGGFLATTSNPLIVSGVTTAMAITANFAPDPVNGTCGSSAGGTFTTAPAVSLCNAGEPSAVSGNGPWGWTCGGTDGGTAAQCSANVSIPSDDGSTIVRDGIINSRTNKRTPDITDALLLLRYIVGASTLTSDQIRHADVAPLGPDLKPLGNNIVDMADVITILRLAVGIH